MLIFKESWIWFEWTRSDLMTYGNKYGGFTLLKHRLEVVQHPYNPCLKASPIASSLYDKKQTIYFFINEMNNFWQHEPRQQKIHHLSFDLHSISCYHGLGTWLALTKKNSFSAGKLTAICDEYGLEKRLSPTERNRELAVDLYPNLNEKRHEICLTTNDEILVFTMDVKHIF